VGVAIFAGFNKLICCKADCDEETDPNSPQCQYGHWITPLTMTVFMIVACLLFLTILVASFK
jgi:hypothetical protein